MRASQLFFKTHKQSVDGETISYQLMIRGGLVVKLGRGLYSYTPVMWRIMKRLVALIRQELEREGAQELLMPQLQPSEIWSASGRLADYTKQKIIFELKDRQDDPYCLGPTHEEVVTMLVKHSVTSYKQLPINLYQISNKFRDEIRPRFGLMRAREFMMKDGYAFCADEEQMQLQYEAMRRAYIRICERLQLRYVIVQADGGSIGRGRSEEFQVLADAGEDALLVTSTHAANVEALTALIDQPSYVDSPLPPTKVATPDTPTIEALSAALSLPAHRIVKTLMYRVIRRSGDTEFVAVCIRADRLVNEVKLTNLLDALSIELASEEELRRVAQVGKGYLGIHPKIKTLGDHSIASMRDFAIGCNEEGMHLIHVTWSKEHPLPELHDLLLAQEGDRHLTTHEPYKAYRGIEVGHIFNLGNKYSHALDAHFTTETGETKAMEMGCYGIGISRLAAAILEQRHDTLGMIWPREIAPFACSIIPVKVHEQSLMKEADELYRRLLDMGYDPLLDDRPDRLGMRLKDSNLLGIPYKLIVGDAWCQEGLLEIEARDGSKMRVAADELTAWAQGHLVKPLTS